MEPGWANSRVSERSDDGALANTACSGHSPKVEKTSRSQGSVAVQTVVA